MSRRYSAAALVELAVRLLDRIGLDHEKGVAVAEMLVEGDLLGHTTHGLWLLPMYLAELERGAMNRSGEPTTIADFPAAVTWDGNRLPGQWLTLRALDLAMERARQLGTCSVAIRRSHHIGCLAAYLKRVTDHGMMVLLTCSDPNVSSVAPHGGRSDVFTPDPIAAAWPTQGDPVILDVSTSIATNGMTNRLRAERKRFPGAWAVAPDGQLTDDPGVLFATPPGALLTVGGADHGHKGYALALLVEALTGGLGGRGRADPKEGWSSMTFVQVLDPALFGGEADFRRQMEHLSQACRATPPRQGFDRVRLPGERGLRLREEYLENGIELYSGIMPALAPWADKLNVVLP